MTDPLDTLYARLTAGRRSGVRDLDPEARRAYQRKATEATRRRQREAVEAGSPEPLAAAVRDALADAALALLAVGGPGSDEVQRVVATVFAGRPGVAGTVAAKARAGTLRPRLLKSS
ncbi:hypothetical protein [Tianweitania sediminis]|uniref:Uncharacterized protein n=1 Tax=Tianweitania sediminis TaxID=1502156 RepID=A0A8J7R2E2_9HYPH|nr:hypothetical protein [Tianweitania sediminis]MBP0439126.1 hypothetical protein [Tianweitania sediminis]